MCGINGFTKSEKERPGIITMMNEATKHRGPDGVGVFSDEHITLGQNLLAITETPILAKQPYVSPDGNFVLVYNGEIYNYKTLRNEQRNEGIIFHTDGDTEVIFDGLMRHGPDYFSKLDGMFAIAFYDKRNQKLFLARDRAGMKPLYYAHDGSTLVFSSELRGIFAYGIPPLLDHEAAKLFFIAGYTPTERTLINGITKVLPGSFITVDLPSGKMKRKWFIERKEENEDINTDPVHLRKKIGKAVSEHTMGLRPFGLYLSGGLDSTIILHELAEREKGLVKTFTTRFETKNPLYNEDADLAKRLTGEYRIDHHELLVTEKDFMSVYESAIVAMEEPRFNLSVPSYWLLAQMASKEVTIVLSGSGGDELFLGYPHFLVARDIAAKYKTYPSLFLDLLYSWRNWRAGFLTPGHFLHLQDPVALWYEMNKITPLTGNSPLRFMDGFDANHAVHFLAQSDAPAIASPLSDRVNAVAELDRWFWLANEDFMRTDKIIMHFGMEGRFPFLANELIRFANAVPSEVKLARGKKSLLRDAYRDLLPEYILDKRKTGWNAPVAEWMSGDFGRMVREVLSPDYYRPTAALFDLEGLVHRELDGKQSFTKFDLQRFMPIAQFQVWAKAFNIQLS